jgi:hypothetical protein
MEWQLSRGVMSLASAPPPPHCPLVVCGWSARCTTRAGRDSSQSRCVCVGGGNFTQLMHCRQGSCLNAFQCQSSICQVYSPLSLLSLLPRTHDHPSRSEPCCWTARWRLSWQGVWVVRRQHWMHAGRRHHPAMMAAMVMSMVVPLQWRRRLAHHPGRHL